MAPIVIQFHIFMQQNWVRAMKWNGRVPEKIEKAWIELRAIRKIIVPPFVVKNSFHQMQFHLFSDTSGKAYIAVVYSKAEYDHGQTCLNLPTVVKDPH